MPLISRSVKESILDAQSVIKSTTRLSLALTFSVAHEVSKLLLQSAQSSTSLPSHIQAGNLNPSDLLPPLIRQIYRLNSLASGAAFATAAIMAMVEGADLVKWIMSDSLNQVRWQEFQNKLQVFYLFEYVDAVLDLGSTPTISLQQMVDRAAALGSFSSVWATEGLGRHFAFRHNLGSGLQPQLLLEPAGGELSAASLLPLHTGMGLALAELSLAKKEGRGNLAKAFLEACRYNARPEYLGATIEAIGLVARSLYPELIRLLDRQFSEIGNELRAYFWHGVGRGVYFLPSNLFPCGDAPWPGYEMCAREPPDALGRENAMAGYTWALLLVNIRHPRVIAAFLEDRRVTAREDLALANGLFSAIVIWLESAAHDANLASFLASPPGLKQSEFELWARYVRPKVQNAVEYHRTPWREIGQLFRYRPPGFADSQKDCKFRA
jgi:hypothetical protein